MKIHDFQVGQNYDLFSVDGEVNKIPNPIHETTWIFDPKISILNTNNI